MVKKKKNVEKRKHKRYRARDGAYAAISPQSRKLGQIINISMGGIAFKYIDTRDSENEEQTEESIFLSSLGYYVGDLPFKTIEDYEITDYPSFSSMKLRQRRVQFKDLTFKQLFDLDFYIRNNVVEPVDTTAPQEQKTK
ncbi:MAG: PilZ domain-containing protein [Desulfobacteraceae bacterium]